MSFGYKMFPLNKHSTLLIRKGKNAEPYVFLQRKKEDKSSFIYLTMSEWEMMVSKLRHIHSMVERVENNTDSGDVSVAGEELMLNNRCIIRVSKLQDQVYVGIFEHEGERINYRRGTNMDGEAWQVLQDKMSEIQTALHELRYRADKQNTLANQLPSKKPVDKVIRPSTLHPPQQVKLPSPPGLMDVTLYSWQHVSSDRSLIYGISDQQFYTKDGAKADADKHPVDFVDRKGVELLISTTPAKLVCHMTPEQLCLRVYVLYLWNAIRKKMNDSYFSCEVEHPAQVQHMQRGCLSDLTERNLDLHLSSAILEVIFSNCIERVLKQLREILPLPEDMSDHIQTCYDMTENDIRIELLNDEVQEIDALINELYFLNNSTNPVWDFMT